MMEDHSDWEYGIVDYDTMSIDQQLLLLAEEEMLHVPELLEQGANPNAKCPYGKTPLHYACLHGDFEIAKMLVARGADVHAKDVYKETPMHMTCYDDSQAPNLETIKFLIENGVHVDVENVYGMTPLHFASENWMVERQ